MIYTFKRKPYAFLALVITINTRFTFKFCRSSTKAWPQSKSLTSTQAIDDSNPPMVFISLTPEYRLWRWSYKKFPRAHAFSSGEHFLCAAISTLRMSMLCVGITFSCVIHEVKWGFRYKNRPLWYSQGLVELEPFGFKLSTYQRVVIGLSTSIEPIHSRGGDSPMQYNMYPWKHWCFSSTVICT